MANFYRRIPRVVRALQFILTDSFQAELEEFTGGRAQIHTDTQPVTIDIREGAAHWLALPGDWIVQLAPDVFRCYSPIDFAAEFEPFPAPEVSGPVNALRLQRGPLDVLKPAEDDNPRCFCPDCGADLGDFYSNRIRMVRPNTKEAGRA